MKTVHVIANTLLGEALINQFGDEWVLDSDLDRIKMLTSLDEQRRVVVHPNNAHFRIKDD